MSRVMVHSSGADEHDETSACEETGCYPVVETYTCVDCDSGDMNREQARWHAHHEGHCVVVVEDE